MEDYLVLDKVLGDRVVFHVRKNAVALGKEVALFRGAEADRRVERTLADGQVVLSPRKRDALSLDKTEKALIEAAEALCEKAGIDVAASLVKESQNPPASAELHVRRGPWSCNLYDAAGAMVARARGFNAYGIASQAREALSALCEQEWGLSINKSSMYLAGVVQQVHGEEPTMCYGALVGPAERTISVSEGELASLNAIADFLSEIVAFENPAWKDELEDLVAVLERENEPWQIKDER